MSITLVTPLDIQNAVVSQDYDEHVERARRNGWCWLPGPNCAVYYYGGIDWAYRNNMTPDIWAAADGEVEQVYNQVSGYGIGVRLKHAGGWVTIYAHMRNAAVKVGDRVKAKQVLGKGDNTGNSTGPHLHFELRNPQGQPVDPAPYLVAYSASAFPVPGAYVQPARVRITASPFLRVRRSASVSSQEVGRLYQGASVDVIEVIEVVKNWETWLRIGHQQFCAAIYKGAVYTEWLEG